MYTSIESKYGIVYMGNQRYYKEDLKKRDYSLEHCTPYYFKIGFDEFIDGSWGGLLQQVSDYLIEEYDFNENQLLEFNVEWSKQGIFFKKPKLHSHFPLKNGLYVNTNHTAIHCCWLLQDLLKFFGINIDDCELLIKRKPIAEAEEVKEYYTNIMKKSFKNFLMMELNKTEDFYNKCISWLDKVDILFKKEFKTFESIYLIDNPNLFASYKSKFITHLMDLAFYSLEQMEGIKKRLDYYTKFVNKTFY